jgi:putative peptidoglycan lipid II flippase
MTDIRERPAAAPRPGAGAHLARGGAAMALGTLVSRATGFLRTAVLTAALGYTGVQDAYNTGNTIPNIVYDLLLGGVLASVVVPILVRAGREDDDGGEGFLSTLFTLIVAALVVVTVAGELLAPLLMRIYLHDDIQGSERQLAVTITRLCLPQLMFYALTALFSAVLTIRGRFGAVGFAPTINNVVVIAITVVFFFTPRQAHVRSWSHLSSGQSLLLGLGTTAGVLAMTATLIPSLTRAGVKIRWRWDLREPRLRAAARLGGWVFAYAAFNQIGYVVISNLATAQRGGATEYANAYQLFQLPYAVVTVSVISTLMPGLSAAALDDDRPAVRGQLSRALRLSAVLLVPAALGMIVLAEPLATAAFHYGGASHAGVLEVGRTLAVFAVGLPAFSAYQLLLRVFYARQDSRTPALINFWANAVNVVADVVAVLVLPADLRVPGLAAGFVLSYVVGSVLAIRRLRIPLGGLDGRRVARLVVRVTLAGTLGGALAYLVSRAARDLTGAGTPAAIGTVLVASAAGGALFLWAAQRMRVRELTGLLALVRR